MIVTTGGRGFISAADSADSTSLTFSTIPAIDTREISTQVLVDNGNTVVLGGIYEQENRNTVNKIPFLGDIPILGAAFRNKVTVSNKKELLIFVTPKILQEGLRVN